MDPAHAKPLIYADEVFRIQGAIFEVNRAMGGGFLEAVYQECLAREFAERRIPFRATPVIPISYKSAPLTATYAPDFICFDSVIVELKASRALAPEHEAQIINYLRAADMKVGLLVNFGGQQATIRRFVY